MSVQRIYAPQAIAADIAKRLGSAAKKLTVGDPASSQTDVGSLITPGEVERIANWVEEAIAEGAQLISGGKRLSATCYACTVLLNPASTSKVSTREIFGPVICIYPYAELEQAISAANSLPYAFQAAVFTRDIDTAMQAYRQLDASTVMLNDHTAFRVDWMPFAGIRESGLGIGGIPYTYHDMQIQKMLVLDSPTLRYSEVP